MTLPRNPDGRLIARDDLSEIMYYDGHPERLCVDCAREFDGAPGKLATAGWFRRYPGDDHLTCDCCRRRGSARGRMQHA